LEKTVASSLPQTGEGARPHTFYAGEKRQARASNYKLPAANLLVYRNLDDLLLDGVGHQLRLVVDVELAHQVELVRLDRLHA